jgi:hypothetical protein
MHDMILNDAENWPHRFYETSRQIGFIQVPRDLHRQCTFITDEYLPAALPAQAVLHDAGRAGEASDPATAHFVFHSAYCCSTMVARALDIPGVAMGLKEPQVLNDVLGWRRRGASEEEVRAALDTALRLLARPFGAGEVNVIKPSNIFNPLAEHALSLVPGSKAVLLYAPIESYLQSIAKKGLWGRRWVRQVLIGTIGDGMLLSGFEDQNLLELTDLQVAALGWLSQHALFRRLSQQLGADRIMLQDSASLLADSGSTMQRIYDHFGLQPDERQFGAVMTGPAFTTHSKDASKAFGAEDRAAEQADMAKLHGEEIALVAQWTEAVAQSQGLTL